MGLMAKTSKRLSQMLVGPDTELGKSYGKLAWPIIAASLGSGGWIYSKWHKRLKEYGPNQWSEDWNDIFHGRFPRHGKPSGQK